MYMSVCTIVFLLHCYYVPLPTAEEIEH